MSLKDTITALLLALVLGGAPHLRPSAAKGTSPDSARRPPISTVWISSA